jgi:hypothetical protein
MSPPAAGKLPESIHRGQSALGRKVHDSLTIPHGQGINEHDHRLRARAGHRSERTFDPIWGCYALRLELDAKRSGGDLHGLQVP